MSSRHETYPLHPDYPPPPSVEEDQSGSAESHLPYDLIYTIMNDYPEAYREYENIIYDFNPDHDAHDINGALHDLQSNSSDDDEEETSEEYETPPATPEQHEPTSIKRDVHRYNVPQIPRQIQQRQHHVSHLPTIVINEHVQPRAATPTLPVLPTHIPAYAQQIYERRSTNGPIYPRQAYREYRSDWQMYDEHEHDHLRGSGGRRHGGYDRVADGRRQRYCAAPRESFPEYEEEYMRVRAEERRAARAFEALSQAFLLTRQIDGKISTLKALLAEVLRGGVRGRMWETCR
ncbi:hypothetical protein PTTW11_04180 [Pyrenophora teres f. teres]|uniref:Uncharacterized protein n=1 Tax=Pyrenophora teres f. teres TaxID=97479 RepID=A0A6S6VYH4_9PLEO|nr:hypothetical protein PTTW11_04180 [Pyrenophora teres f. teres]